jgi:A/G-specific adenine glycosylase
MDNRYFSDKVVEWYKTNKRDLPWRHTKDPYKIWLSEIILQQTRVNQGMPYYYKFVETFPTVEDLASASEQSILRLWQGLGYYTRARNLHKCAKAIVSRFNGKFPTNYADLLQLPGIGEYTAAAIASFSFNEPVAVLDGNVFRMLSRYFGIDAEINSPEGKKIFSKLANELVNRGTPDLHNQAFMEFGALHCIPKNPPCRNCDFQSTCHAAIHGRQLELPTKLKKKASRKRYFYYLVFRRGDKLLMRKRTQTDIWHGLYDFELIEKNKPLKTDDLLSELNGVIDYKFSPADVEISQDYKHILTHQVIHAKFILINAGKVFSTKNKNLKFYTFDKIYDLPKPVLITRFLSDYKNFYS